MMSDGIGFSLLSEGSTSLTSAVSVGIADGHGLEKSLPTSSGRRALEKRSLDFDLITSINVLQHIYIFFFFIAYRAFGMTLF